MKIGPLVLGLLLYWQAALTGSTLHPGDHILFIGDSITGQGRNRDDGWAHLIDRALKRVDPSSKYTSVSLGGSGQGVQTWQDVEKRSRSESFSLDVKDTDVREVLDKGADVVIFMLGMNDVLAPRLRNEAAEYEKWAAEYRKLIQTVRDRVKPRVIALATPTLCTEVLDSPKNEVMQELITQIGHLAKTEGLIILPTNQTMSDLLLEGRRYQPDFHVTEDSVHPNAFGHIAIAAGMLKGLGQESAAELLLLDHQALWKPENKNSVAWSVRHLGQAEEADTFEVTYSIPSAEPNSTTEISLEAPSGWTVKAQELQPSNGRFLVTGKPDHLANKLNFKAHGCDTTVVIPAPWLIGTAMSGNTGWNLSDGSFDAERGRLSVDQTLAEGKGLGTTAELAPGEPITWTRYFPTIGYGGDNAPGAIDLAAITFFQNFSVAYGARWLHVEKETPIRLKITPTGFGCHDYLSVWLNGEAVFEDHIDTDKSTERNLTLRPGWNALIFKSNHLQWQWQYRLDLKTIRPQDEDALLVRTSSPH